MRQRLTRLIFVGTLVVLVAVIAVGSAAGSSAATTRHNDPQWSIPGVTDFDFPTLPAKRQHQSDSFSWGDAGVRVAIGIGGMLAIGLCSLGIRRTGKPLPLWSALIDDGSAPSG